MERRATVRVGLAVGLVAAIGVVWMLRSGGVGTEEQTPGLSAERNAAKHPVAVASAKAQLRLAAVETAAHQSPASDSSDRTDTTDQARSADASVLPAPAAPVNLATPTRAGPEPLSDESLADPGKVQDRYANCEVLDEQTSPVDAAGQYERVRVVRTNEKYPLIRVVEKREVRDQRSESRDQRSEGRDQRSEVRGRRSEVGGRRSESRGQTS